MSTNCVQVLESALANVYQYFHDSFWGMAYGKCLSTKQIPLNVSALSKYHSIQYSEKKFIQARGRGNWSTSFIDWLNLCSLSWSQKPCEDWANSVGFCKLSKFSCKYTIWHACHLTFLYLGSLKLKNKTYHISYLTWFTD